MLSALDSWVPVGDVISFRVAESLLLHLDKILAPSCDDLSHGTLLSWDPVIEWHRGCLAGRVTCDAEWFSGLFISLRSNRDGNVRSER